MKIRFDTSGLDWDGAIEELVRRTQEGVKNACTLIEADAVKRAPEDSTALENRGNDYMHLSMSITSAVDTDRYGKVTGVVGSGLDYAVYVHEGTGIEAPLGRKHDLPWTYRDDAGNFFTTSGQKPNPFLRDAYEANEEAAQRMIQEAIRNG